MRAQRAGMPPLARASATVLAAATIVAFASGAIWWAWTEAASVLSLRGPVQLPLGDASRATWRLLDSGDASRPGRAFPTVSEQRAAPEDWAYLLSALGPAAALTWGLIVLRRRLGFWRAASPLAFAQRSVPGRAVRRGWVHHRTWADAGDLRRLWVPKPGEGRPYLGLSDGPRAKVLAAEPEVQPMVIAPPRAGKSSGYVIPWLLDHKGPVLVLSTKRDVYEASVCRRGALGRTWVYDPFGTPDSACFTPLIPAVSWDGAIRAGEALASAAHPDQTNAANEFWDKEAASMLAPLLHAAAVGGTGIGRLIHWLDTRSFTEATRTLKAIGASAAADQLEGIERRDERNRETTVMSALNLLRAYRYPQLAEADGEQLTPGAFLDAEANTVYVIAAGHDQDALRPVVLALVSAIYETAVTRARRGGPLDPRLLILLDEAANIAPVRNLASWLSQCGDHGILIATIWQSIAQIDQRYGRAARDAICAASTAQVFIPPLAEPTTSGYLSGVLGEELVAHPSRSGAATVTHAKTAQAPWLRQVPRGRAILVYRDLPPALVRAPGWFEDPRFARYRAEVTAACRPGSKSSWPRELGGGQHR